MHSAIRNNPDENTFPSSAFAPKPARLPVLVLLVLISALACMAFPRHANAAELSRIEDWYNDPDVSYGYISSFEYSEDSFEYTINDSRIKFKPNSSFWTSHKYPAFVYDKPVNVGDRIELKDAVEITFKNVGLKTDGTHFDIYARFGFTLTRTTSEWSNNSSVNLLEWEDVPNKMAAFEIITGFNPDSTTDVINTVEVYFEARDPGTGARIDAPLNYYIDDIDTVNTYPDSTPIPEYVKFNADYGSMFIDKNSLLTVSENNTKFSGNSETASLRQENVPEFRVMYASTDGRCQFLYQGYVCDLDLGCLAFGYPRQDEDCVTKSVDRGSIGLEGSLVYTTEHAIKYTLGDEATGYTDVSMSDTFNDALDTGNATVKITRSYIDENNERRSEDATAQFEKTVSGQTIALAAKTPRTVMGLYSVTTTIPLKSEFARSALRQNSGKYYIDNTATLTINGKSFSSNKVSTELLYPIVGIEKADGNGTPLPGAKLRISDARGTQIDAWESDGTTHWYTIFDKGEYTLSESKPPVGYAAAAPVSFSYRNADENGIIRLKLIDESLDPKLSITKTADPIDGSTVMLGDAITYTITVSNAADAGFAPNTVVRDAIPKGCRFREGSCSAGGAYDAQHGYVQWSGLSLNPGESKQMSFAVTVWQNNEKKIRNTAYTAAKWDGKTAPNIASNTTEHLFANTVPTLAETHGGIYAGIAGGAAAAALAGSAAWKRNGARKRKPTVKPQGEQTR